MATVDATDWTRQASSPFIDGNYPKSVRPGAGSVTANISTQITTGPAPLGVMFDASGSSGTLVTNDSVDLKYELDFDSTNVDPTLIFENYAGIDPNKGFGVACGHVYKNPGTYTAELRVTDSSGATDTATVVITVLDAYTSATDVYIVAFDSNFTGAPETKGAGTQITTFAALDAVFQGMSSTSPETLILIKRGTSATVLDGEALDARNSDNRLTVDAWGSGDKPELIMDALKDDWLFFGDMEKFTVSNLKISGTYDPTVNPATGNRVTGFFSLAGSHTNLIYQCEMTGMGLNIYFAGTDPLTDYHNMLVDCNINTWSDYGRLDSGGQFGCVIGNSIKQNVNAISTGDGKGAGGPDHGPMRIAIPNKFCIQYNDLFNNAGWSSAGLAHQACIRVGTSATPENTVVSHNDCEGGFYQMEAQVANNGVVAGDAATLVIEKNRTITTGNTEHSFVSCFGGWTFRNNLAVKSQNEGPPLGSGTFEGMVMVYQVSTDSTAAIAATSRIYNNTMICRQTNGTFTDDTNLLQINTAFTRFDVDNNIGYVLNSSATNTGLIDMRHAGGVSNITENHNIFYCPDGTDYSTDNGTGYTLANWRVTTSQGANSLESDPLFDTIANDDGAILIGSPARNAGEEVTGLIDDRNDVDRDSTPDIGAVEYV